MPGFFRRRVPPVEVVRTVNGPPNRPVEDRRIAACPYCGVELKKVPGAATRCPDCHQTMFVRTDHRTQTRNVVTGEQAAETDDANEAIAMGDLAGYERRVRDTKDRLRKKFGTEPSFGDVRWAMLNEDLMTHGAHRDFGLYRNTRYKMMDELDRSGRAGQALQTALEVFYMDQCDPNNLGGFVTRGTGIRAWGPAPQLVAGSLTEWIGDRCEKLGITVEKAARDYEPSAERTKASLKMPRSWSAIWPHCV